MIQIGFEKIRNIIYRSSPVVVHAPGKEKLNPSWNKIKSYFYQSPPKKIGAIKDLTIITWNSGTEFVHYNNKININKKLGECEQSLKHLGVPYVVLGQDIGSKWKNKMKIQLTLDYLPKIKTKYILAADSSDVLFLDSPEIVKNIYIKYYENKMVFNSELFEFRKPFSPIWGKEADRWVDFEHSISNEPLRHLNSGLWIGEKMIVKSILKKCSSINIHNLVKTNELNEESLMSDQVIYKHVFLSEFPQMTLDYNCKMFQNTCGLNYEEILF